MKRLGLYVIYDAMHIIDEYIGVVLAELKKNCEELMVICNFPLITMGESYLDSVDHVEFRKNKGYDFGAWKDALCDYIGWGKLEKFDEIVLTNDSYFAPFFSFEKMFDEMESQNVDFWGITEHPEGIWSNNEEYDKHIQSYFLCVRRRMFLSDVFKDYWNKLDYPMDYESAVLRCETRFTEYFYECGFRYLSYINIHNSRLKFEKSQDPTLDYGGYLIRELKIPILKKKSLSFSSRGFVDTVDALKYIEDNHFYDTSILWKHIFRLCGNDAANFKFNYSELEKFYHKHRQVFLYGNGDYGKKMKKYFEYKSWKYAAVLTTYKESEKVSEVNSLVFSDADFNSNDGVIICADKISRDEILNSVRSIFREDQILFCR